MSYHTTNTQQRTNAFTLVELLVVIGIIALLISLLLPALNKAQANSKSVVCKSNLRQNFMVMLMYSQENKGWMFPTGAGAGLPHDKVLPYLVFKPAKWNPPSMVCPADEHPELEHSYVVNSHIPQYKIRYGATKGVPPDQVILMGEKKSSEPDYYMDADQGDFDRVVELYRHGFYVGSNYAYMDGHVDSQSPSTVRETLDPWDPANNPNTDPVTDPNSGTGAGSSN